MQKEEADNEDFDEDTVTDFDENYDETFEDEADAEEYFWESDEQHSVFSFEDEETENLITDMDIEDEKSVDDSAEFFEEDSQNTFDEESPDSEPLSEDATDSMVSFDSADNNDPQALNAHNNQDDSVQNPFNQNGIAAEGQTYTNQLGPGAKPVQKTEPVSEPS